jgi:acetyltransferase-like isoleucine patch superfamily enzyme
MVQPIVRAGRAEIAPDVELGEGVLIEADEVVIKAGARIGHSDADSFRTPPGVVIRADRVILGSGVSIDRAVRVEGGTIQLDDGVRVRRNTTINVLESLHIGAAGTVGESCEISGRQISIGQELWMLPQAKIGGGSGLERASRLDAGHFLHLGVHTLINTARPVRIGHEVGLGTRTSVYTHGAYPSRLMGFPVAFEGVEIGDFSWVPGAIINPGVRIGRNCVIGVNSLVSSSIPDGSLAAGSPARVIRENAYPRPLTREQRLEFFDAFLASYSVLLGADANPERVGDAVMLRTVDVSVVAGDSLAIDELPGHGRTLVVGDGVVDGEGRSATAFDTASRTIRGPADQASERLSNELRRNGIRFYSRPAGAAYQDWTTEIPRN